MIGGCFFMKKLTNKTIFNKSTTLISGILGKYNRTTNKDYKYSKKYGFNDHILSMILLQFSDSKGLRDVTSKYRAHKKLGKEFKIPSFSQLSRLNKNKPCEIFSDIFREVLTFARKELRCNVDLKEFKDIKIIDSTMITIAEKLAPGLHFEDHKSAIRVSTLLSQGTELPEKITIVPATIGERSCITDYVTNTDCIYLFDKGYYKYSWYDAMSENNIKFVTRQQSTAITEEYRSSYTGVDNLYDYEITMGTEYSKNKTTHKYREILYFENGNDEEFRLVTNIFNLPAERIVALYKIRWKIECFFKWIKQHLTIKNWVGHNFNAIATQIYCALIVYILLLLIRNRFKSALSLFNILRKLRANLTETYVIRNILTG